MERVLDSYGNIRIVKRDDSSLPIYQVIEPQFSERELQILKNPNLLGIDYDSVQNTLGKLSSIDEKEDFLKRHIRNKLEKKGIVSENINDLVLRIMDEVFFGYGRIGPLMRDNRLEEIMINGVNKEVFVVHRSYGMCITNIKYENYESIQKLIDWLSFHAGRKIDSEHPLLDGHMPDGSRANIVISPAAPKGPAITIRKFKRTPYTIIDLISMKFISVDLAAFLWLCIEGLGIHPCNMLIAGGSGSGKTTLLNALAMFIPQYERIITIEDTLELNFDFLRNWVPLEARPTLIGRIKSEVDMQVLVENSLRMRPDRIIVGEVRGREAETLFVAMDIGLNGSMGTIHSNSAKETVIRLTTEPMNVPVKMFPLLDLIIVTNRHYERKLGLVRRISEVGEIAGLEGDIVQIGKIYRWDSKTDRIVRTGYPILLKDKMTTRLGITKNQLNLELLRRCKVLEYMVLKRIRNKDDVVRIFQEYHNNPNSVLSKLGINMHSQ
ncbi:MAG: CpaF family protein [Candidatus Altiarchaeales archaeon]|nr:MAG: CpaF family protein [Candidatus Altiarchaeales archaeon]RLI95297.1 MAG: CpaF family protein [Candidatus Altiarchaeales archaeon]RLI95516.1 MAG: CpaF family protein [Candidatus Altiarchaeales archaeon]HDO82285.1 CpaF family protein [Candidatus Altiarchaeales archaeon]HEX54934.1 CpaF family protein [Candidatus Altiarchaeales archaeon]